MEWAIDAKDRAILYHLDRDARQPVSKLAKKVKMNREVVRYRIEKMVRDGLIQKFLTFVAIPDSGYIVTSVYFRFQDTSAKDEEEMVKYLKEKKEVIWLASMDGRFNLGFTICTQSVREIADFIDDFKNRYQPFLSDFQMASVVRAWRFFRKYLVEEEMEKPVEQKIIQEVKLDPVDRKILAALGEDGRMSAVQISKKAGVSPDAVADRIHKMKKSGLVTNVGVVLDNLRINRRLFRSFVTFHNLVTVEKKFLKYCYLHPNAIQAKRMLGAWEYEVDLEVQDETELRRIHSQFKADFKETVRSTSFVSIFKIHKFNLTGFLER